VRALEVDAKAIAELDKVLHEPVRLAIVGCLFEADEADFVFLQSQTGITGGNLSAHIRRLAQEGYVEVEKSFDGGRPRTTLRLTAAGRTAFSGYIETVRAFLATFD
jgi:DNA-binding MarR family transcriptional regulator